MLTKVTAYSQWATVDPLVLNVVERPETDLFEVRNIDGLEPVKADVNTTPLASIDGESFDGTNVGKRNIVLTLGLDPDWDIWTVSKLRNLLSKYFMPKQSIRLVFERSDFSPVEISGWIESNEPSIFSKDPEQQISIICPDLYFRSVDYVYLSGESDDDPVVIEYEGDVETGLFVRVEKTFGVSSPDPDTVYIQVEEPSANYAQIDDTPVFTAGETLHWNSVAGHKYVRKQPVSGPTENMLRQMTGNWVKITPGTETFHVYGADPASKLFWQLQYYNLFGGL